MALPLPVPVTGLRQVIAEVAKSKTGIVGFSMLGLLIGVAIVVPVIAPFDVARSWGSRQPWVDNPRDAAPEWTEAFAGKRLPRTLILTPCHDARALPMYNATGSERCSGGGWDIKVQRTQIFDDFVFIEMEQSFVYDADVFPSELSLYVWGAYGPAAPLLNVEWRRPDHVNLSLLQIGPTFRAPDANFFPISTDRQSRHSVHEGIRNWAITNYSARDVSIIHPEVTLFAQAGPDMLDARAASVLKGVYTLYVEFQYQGTELGMDAKAVIFGTVYGLAGTDSSRRDLLVGLLWGAPVALAFGSAAAVVIVVLQTILGALATWYGGWWDELIQRAADVLLILPLLPILLLIAIIYDPSIWILLVVLIAFGFVGSTSKVARSIVLQVKEEAYIESAISYGASRARILFKHILPRLLPYTFALIALSVPTFIFLEASLSFLGYGDPQLPTWGSVLGDAYRGNATFNGFWWWIAFPALGITFATIAFALLGYSFDKVLNPRLREQ